MFFLYNYFDVLLCVLSGSFSEPLPHQMPFYKRFRPAVWPEPLCCWCYLISSSTPSILLMESERWSSTSKCFGNWDNFEEGIEPSWRGLIKCCGEVKNLQQSTRKCEKKFRVELGQPFFNLLQQLAFFSESTKASDSFRWENKFHWAGIYLSFLWLFWDYQQKKNSKIYQQKVC